LTTAEQVGVGDNAATELNVIVHRLATGLEKAEGEQRELEALERQLAECSLQRERNGVQLQEIERELRALFSEGDAEDEAQFRQRAHAFQRSMNLEEAREQHLRNLEKLGGRKDDQARFQEELGQCSPAKLAGERSDLDQEVMHLEEELSALQESYGRLDERREQLESAEELSSLRQRRNILLTDLEEAARRWSVLKVCLNFLQQARQIYEMERKQPVVRESENFFRAITDDKYQAILAPHGEESIQVVGANGTRYHLDTLSRGTAEQLYLSLRFGYIREFGRRARPLPVVMDDILVNFDPRRAKEAIKAMMELATENQVLFFTCHPESVALIREFDPGIPIWRLEGGKGFRIVDFRL
jgi:uncharacterized protein YhaN